MNARIAEAAAAPIATTREAASAARADGEWCRPKGSYDVGACPELLRLLTEMFFRDTDNREVIINFPHDPANFERTGMAGPWTGLMGSIRIS